MVIPYVKKKAKERKTDKTEQSRLSQQVTLRMI
jgi:hypothetical protein